MVTGLYWDKPEKWRDEDVPEDQWEDFIKGIKEMKGEEQMGLHEDLVDSWYCYFCRGWTSKEHCPRCSRKEPGK